MDVSTFFKVLLNQTLSCSNALFRVLNLLVSIVDDQLHNYNDRFVCLSLLLITALVQYCRICAIIINFMRGLLLIKVLSARDPFVKCVYFVAVTPIYAIGFTGSYFPRS